MKEPSIPKPLRGHAGPAHDESPKSPASRVERLAIGDLARQFDISTRAIRFYEARGLIRPERRGATRVFSPADRHRLGLILRAKNLGLTLEEIGDHLAIHDAALETQDTASGESPALRARIDRHIATLACKRADLQTTLKELREIRARLTSPTRQPRDRRK